MRNLEQNEKRNYDLIQDYDYKIMLLTKELNQTKEELSNTKGHILNASTTQRDYRSVNNLSKLEDFNPRTAENNSNINNNYNNMTNTNFDYNSRPNNFSCFNSSNHKVDRMESFTSQDYGNITNNKIFNNTNNINGNANEYEYVPSSCK